MSNIQVDKPIGGTELLYNSLSSKLDFSHVNLILSICHHDLLSDSKPNILWQHLNWNEENTKLLADEKYVQKLDSIVFVSHWQHEQFRKKYEHLNNVKCHVIQNAVENFEKEKTHPKPDRIKLIYTSTPWRGLNILIEVLKKLNRDVDIDVYSGTKIYGPEFYKSTEGQFDVLYEELKKLNVNHIEYAPNKEVRKAVSESHILAYPSLFEETSCLSAIEALSAGCKVVTTNFGALPETCSVWGDYVCLGPNIVKEYTKLLQNAIDSYWDNYEERVSQRYHYKQFWSWEKRVLEWESFLNEYK